MARSSKKGPYIDQKLLKKVVAQKRLAKKSRLRRGLGPAKFRLSLWVIPLPSTTAASSLKFLFLKQWLAIVLENLPRPELFGVMAKLLKG
jgi:hypothetical protein